MIRYGYECENKHSTWEDIEHVTGWEAVCAKCGKPLTLLFMVSEYRYPDKKKD